MSTSPELLVLAAHPDDIEFGCGAVIARENQLGRSAHFALATRGEASTHGSPAERESETRRGAEFLGASFEFLDLGRDAQLEASLESSLRIASLIRRLRPRWVLAPSGVENQHPDHVVVSTLARQAARLARYGGVTRLAAHAPHAIEAFFFYAITVEGEPGESPLLLDVSDSTVVGRWRESMEAHQTQLRTRNYVELQLTRARQAGLRAGVEYAWPIWPAESPVVDSLQQVGRGARRF